MILIHNYVNNSTKIIIRSILYYYMKFNMLNKINLMMHINGSAAIEDWVEIKIMLAV